MNTYRCYYEDCQKTYNSKYNLIRHLNSYHLDNKSYMCSSCSKGFYNKLCLNLHSDSCGISSHESRCGLYADLSLITDYKPRVMHLTPPLLLPVLPRIEKDRQVPLRLAKIPVHSLLFGLEI